MYYYAVVSVLLQCPTNAVSSSIIAALAEDSRVVYAPSEHCYDPSENSKEVMGGLGMFENVHVYGENIDIENFDFDEFIHLVDPSRCHTDGQLSWDEHTRDGI